MNLIPVSELFYILPGNSLELNRLEQVGSCKDGIAFVSRKMNDNGISAYVTPIESITPFESGLITCALSGNGILSSFIQEQPFYTGYHIACLKPRIPLSKAELLYYCLCIRANRYKYSYGRQANKTLKTLLIPNIDQIPNFVKRSNLEINSDVNSSVINDNIKLHTCNWKSFKYDEIFIIQKGYYNKKPPVSLNSNDIPFIGATEKNNGITSWIDRANLKKYYRDGKLNYTEPMSNKLFSENCITVSNNGSVGEAFYQSRPFTCSHDVNPLYLRNKKMNIYIAMFLITLIKAEKYRWGYGRKWRPTRMPNSIIKLPVTEDGNPDWLFMENYIKSLPFSSQI